jgi:hypothetical protein
MLAGIAPWRRIPISTTAQKTLAIIEGRGPTIAKTYYERQNRNCNVRFSVDLVD